MLRPLSLRAKPIKNEAFLAWYKEQNPLCELFELLWQEQPAFLQQIWPGRLFRDAVYYVATETHHIWHPGNRPDLLSNLIRLSKPIHDWSHVREPILGRVICSWAKLQKGETDLGEIRTASGFHLEGWLETDKVVGRCRQVDRWWNAKRREAIGLIQCLGSPQHSDCPDAERNDNTMHKPGRLVTHQRAQGP